MREKRETRSSEPLIRFLSNFSANFTLPELKNYIFFLSVEVERRKKLEGPGWAFRLCCVSSKYVLYVNISFSKTKKKWKKRNLFAKRPLIHFTGR